jgi:hypothetical protein
MMEIELKTCVIRPWRPGDEESLVAHANNYSVWRNLRDRFPHPYTTDDAREWIRRMCEESLQTNFAIVVDGEAAGGIGLVLNGDIHRCSAEIGYWLGEAFWGRGRDDPMGVRQFQPQPDLRRRAGMEPRFNARARESRLSVRRPFAESRS